MSNIQAPFGFQQTSTLTGASPNYVVVHRQIASNNSHQIGRGDPVIELSNGYIDIALSTSTLLYGVFDGVNYYDTTQQKKLWLNGWTAPTSSALSGTVLAAVIVDPMATFKVQAGGSSTTGVTLANIGLNATFGGQGAPNSAGYSVAYLDISTISTTNTLPFRIIGLNAMPNNDTTAAYDTVAVTFNTQSYKQTTGV